MNKWCITQFYLLQGKKKRHNQGAKCTEKYMLKGKERKMNI